MEFVCFYFNPRLLSPGTLLSVVLFLVHLLPSSNTQNLDPLPSSLPEYSSSSLLCLPKLTTLNHEISFQQPHSREESFVSCEIWNDQDDSVMSGSFRLDVPLDNMNQQIMEKLRSGHQDILLEIPGGSLTLDSVIAPGEILVRAHLDRRQLSSTPTRTLKWIMIRISTKDSTPDFTAQELYNYMMEADPSPRKQFERCSNHALTFSDELSVVDIFVNVSASDQSVGTLNNLAEGLANEKFQTSPLKEQYGITNVRGWADLIIFVVPPGTGNWATSAVVPGKMSIFNNRWAGSVGALMHVFGHNLGLRNSYLNNQENNMDQTGYMGREGMGLLTPTKCYNAYNHYRLGWFGPHTIELDATMLVQETIILAAFVDYDHIMDGVAVVVRVGDLYMQYNRATRHNNETGQLANHLVVVRELNVETDLQGGLITIGDEQTFTASTGPNGGSVDIHVKVCEIQNRPKSNLAGVDYMRITIATQPQAQCTPPLPSTPPPQTTGAPSLAPTQAPSFRPTTRAPTESPVLVTTAPSFRPSSKPSTMAPTKSPVVAPTQPLQPTMSPSTAQPTMSPSTAQPTTPPLTAQATTGPSLHPTSSPVDASSGTLTKMPTPPPTPEPSLDSSTRFPTLSPAVTQIPTQLEGAGSFQASNVEQESNDNGGMRGATNGASAASIDSSGTEAGGGSSMATSGLISLVCGLLVFAVTGGLIAFWGQSKSHGSFFRMDHTAWPGLKGPAAPKHDVNSTLDISDHFPTGYDLGLIITDAEVEIGQEITDEEVPSTPNVVIL